MHAQRVELLAQDHSHGVSGHQWSPSVCRAGDLPSTPCCHPGNGRRVMKKEGEAGWGPGPGTWSPPAGRFSFIPLVEGQPLNWGLAHLEWPQISIGNKETQTLSGRFYALRLSGAELYVVVLFSSLFSCLPVGKFSVDPFSHLHSSWSVYQVPSRWLESNQGLTMLQTSTFSSLLGPQSFRAAVLSPGYQ